MRAFVTIAAFAVATLAVCGGGGCHSTDADLPRYDYAFEIRRDAKVLLTTTRPADTDLFTADAAGTNK